MGKGMSPTENRNSRTFQLPTRGINRRRFLYSSAAVSVAALFAGPGLLRGRDLNGKLNIGMIGLGGKSGDNLKGIAGENVVALCDVTALRSIGSPLDIHWPQSIATSDECWSKRTLTQW